MIALMSGSGQAQYEFVTRVYPKYDRNDPIAELLRKEKKWDELFKTVLFQRISEGDEKVWYRPINKLGARYYMTEVYSQDNMKSVVPENEYIDESKQTSTPDSMDSIYQRIILSEVYKQSTQSLPFTSFVNQAREFIEFVKDTLTEEQIIEQLKCL
jgi:hypothetical protein